MKQMVELPSAERLHEMFSYERSTGIIRWRVRRKGVKPDMAAGALSRGYIVVRIDGILFRAHRVIWKMMTGSDPYDQVDHKDTNRSNNAWDNLREATNSKNMMNARLSSANTSGFKGIVWDHGAWSVRIKINGKSHYFGRYKCLDEAARRMTTERERLHGEFARAA